MDIDSSYAPNCEYLRLNEVERFSKFEVITIVGTGGGRIGGTNESKIMESLKFYRMRNIKALRKSIHGYL